MPVFAPLFLQPLFDKPVAIFGGGLSGRATAGLVSKLGGESVIYDEKAQAGDLRSFTPSQAGEHDLVVFSPGFRVGHPWLMTAASAGCFCVNELDFASMFWRGRILAITGTNGKTTLTEFATHALRLAKFQASACGNIGFSFSRLVAEREGGDEDEIAVCEVSSFQSETLASFAADYLVWTNFAEDHLERHPGMKAYFSAKYEALTRTDPAFVFVGSSVTWYAGKLGFVLPSGCETASEGQPAVPGLEETVFSDYPQRENFILLRALWLRLGLPEKTLIEAAHSFSLGRHRLALVRELGGVGYWNDSKATNFHAVEAALGRFASPVILIAGGKAKGGDIPAFVRRIASRVKFMLLIGATKEILAAACCEQGVEHELCTTLDEAVAKAAAMAVPGDQVLLSPAFASFDMFRGYDHRGEIFEQLVNHLTPAVADKTRAL